MTEPVIQRHTGDADAVIAHVGEIGKPQPSRRMLLPEDNVLLGGRRSGKTLSVCVSYLTLP